MLGAPGASSPEPARPTVTWGLFVGFCVPGCGEKNTKQEVRGGEVSGGLGLPSFALSPLGPSKLRPSSLPWLGRPWGPGTVCGCGQGAGSAVAAAHQREKLQLKGWEQGIHL